MTEAEWFDATESAIRDAVRSLGTRRSRLFATACCRLLSQWIPGPSHGIVSDALGAVERFADTEKSKAALKRARQAVRGERYRLNTPAGLSVALIANGSSALWTVEVAATENVSYQAVVEVLNVFRVTETESLKGARSRLYPLYRDIAGNPFRPVMFDPGWRTSTVAALAEQMYGSRDFAPMPLLADALQDAGCDNEAILAHCRDPEGIHVRGCWVVDLILGKN